MDRSSSDNPDSPEESYVGATNGYFVIRPVGNTGGEDLSRLAAAAARHEAFSTGSPLMWDLRWAIPHEVDSIADITHRVRQLLQNTDGGRTAFVVSDELTYGLSRAGATWSSLDSERELQVFFAADFDAAVAWLTE